MTKEMQLPMFTIERKSPEKMLQLLTSLARANDSRSQKSYNVTNDEQCYELVRRVLAKELTIKKVSDIVIVGRTDVRDQLHHSEDNNEGVQERGKIQEEKGKSQSQFENEPQPNRHKF
eukprot:TRINITY_DN14574_c0_g2_i1.p1 TRINITY_DN14574_c0_g2~~TRINITY_DN14574_c0_g2_i1.p1  ORF type:complete len:118 (-),score=10.94 TRINITY_DN14574_c0_g2_i1:410-763(-)